MNLDTSLQDIPVQRRAVRVYRVLSIGPCGLLSNKDVLVKVRNNSTFIRRLQQRKVVTTIVKRASSKGGELLCDNKGTECLRHPTRSRAGGLNFLVS